MMDEEKTGFSPEQEEDCPDSTVEKTRKTVRRIGNIIFGILAAVLAAEAISFKKKSELRTAGLKPAFFFCSYPLDKPGFYKL